MNHLVKEVRSPFGRDVARDRASRYTVVERDILDQTPSQYGDAH